MKNYLVMIAVAAAVAAPVASALSAATDKHRCTVQTEMVREIVNARNKGITEEALVTVADNTATTRTEHTMIVAAVGYVYSIERKKLPLAARAFYNACLTQE